MSQENVELVQKGLRAFMATHRPSEFTAPDYVWDMSAYRGWLDQPEYRGAEEFMEFFAKWTEPYEEWDLEVEDLVDADRGRVVVTFRQRGRLKGADSWVDLQFAAVYTIAEGLIQRIKVFAPPEEAREAVGLSE